jgi:hypothetical protein
MEAEKLQEVLRLHKLWMNGDSKGCRANLHWIDLRGANLYGARGAIVSAGPAGSERRITYYFTGHDEVQCGCFGGTLAEFEAKVETEHKEHPLWLAEYRAMIVYFKALRALEIEKTERKEEKEADDDDSDDNA